MPRRLIPENFDSTIPPHGRCTASGLDKIDPTWELADFAADAAWREVEEFIRNEKANPPRTARERKARKALLVETLSRYYCRAMEVYAQAESGGFSTEKN